MEKIIEVKDLTFSYKNKNKALDKITFSVDEGEVFGFLGPNGSGKSTTQKLCIGILKNYQGSIKVLGKEIKTWKENLYEYISVLFEYPYLYSNLSAYDNLKYFASFYPENKRRNIDELLDKLELQRDFRNKPVESYSKGMRQRANMARALISSPKILFLDEPTSGLDPNGAALFRNIIKEEKEKGTTIFLTTHNMHDAELLCDRIAFIVNGQIKEINSPENFKELYSKNEIRIKYIVEKNIEERAISKEEFLSKLDWSIDEIISVHSVEPNLEDIFIQVTGKELIKNE